MHSTLHSPESVKWYETIEDSHIWVVVIVSSKIVSSTASVESSFKLFPANETERHDTFQLK